MEQRNPKRNSEGYYDPTAYEAIKGMHREGEIWTFRKKNMLVIKNNGKICNCLALSEVAMGDDDIKVGKHFFTNPAMIQYVFTDTLDIFVDRLMENDFKAVLQAVGDALGVELICKRNGQTQNEELVKLKIQHKYLQHMYDDLLQKLIERAVLSNG